MSPFHVDRTGENKMNQIYDKYQVNGVWKPGQLLRSDKLPGQFQIAPFAINAEEVINALRDGLKNVVRDHFAPIVGRVSTAAPSERAAVLNDEVNKFLNGGLLDLFIKPLFDDITSQLALSDQVRENVWEAERALLTSYGQSTLQPFARDTLIWAIHAVRDGAPIVQCDPVVLGVQEEHCIEHQALPSDRAVTVLYRDYDGHDHHIHLNMGENLARLWNPYDPENLTSHEDNFNNGDVTKVFFNDREPNTSVIWYGFDSLKPHHVTHVKLFDYHLNATQIAKKWAVDCSHDGQRWETALEVNDHVFAPHGYYHPLSKPAIARYWRVRASRSDLSSPGFWGLSEVEFYNDHHHGHRHHNHGHGEWMTAKLGEHFSVMIPNTTKTCIRNITNSRLVFDVTISD